MADERKLYKEGDAVPLEFQMYPGPVPFKTTGKVVKCLSPTFYEIEFKDQRGQVKTRRFIRSQLN